MTDETLTAERILDATEEVLRRFGPARATIADVARVLGVSHGSVYRYFPSKALLRDAVIGRWFTLEATTLTEIATRDSPASERLRNWFDHLIASKRRKAFNDPELFATYVELAADTREVVKAHLDGLVEQVSQIIADGVTRRLLQMGSPKVSLRRQIQSHLPGQSFMRPPSSTIRSTHQGGLILGSTSPSQVSGPFSCADLPSTQFQHRYKKVKL